MINALLSAGVVQIFDLKQTELHPIGFFIGGLVDPVTVGPEPDGH